MCSVFALDNMYLLVYDGVVIGTVRASLTVVYVLYLRTDFRYILSRVFGAHPCELKQFTV